MSLTSFPTSPGTEKVAQINAALQGQDITAFIQQDIAQLSGHIECIQQLFVKVLRALEDYDDTYSNRDTNNHLSPGWRNLQRRFNEYVFNSRRNAIAAHSIMHSYTCAVLDNVGKTNCDVQSLVNEIGIFKENVEQHKRAADETMNDFKDLATQVRGFERNVRNSVVACLGIKISDVMAKTCEKIGDLQQKVADITDQISIQESGFLAKIAAYVPSVAKVLCTLSPTAAWEAMRCACIGRGTVDEDMRRQQAQQELEDELARAPKLLKQDEVPAALRPFYQEWWAPAQENMHTVSTRVGAISKIWGHLYGDLTDLETKLSLCSGSQNVSQSIFLMEKIEVSRTVLDRLVECLRLYARQVPIAHWTTPGVTV